MVPVSAVERRVCDRQNGAVEMENDEDDQQLISVDGKQAVRE